MSAPSAPRSASGPRGSIPRGSCLWMNRARIWRWAGRMRGSSGGRRGRPAADELGGQLDDDRRDPSGSLADDAHQLADGQGRPLRRVGGRGPRPETAAGGHRRPGQSRGTQRPARPPAHRPARRDAAVPAPLLPGSESDRGCVGLDQKAHPVHRSTLWPRLAPHRPTRVAGHPPTTLSKLVRPCRLLLATQLIFGVRRGCAAFSRRGCAPNPRGRSPGPQSPSTQPRGALYRAPRGVSRRPPRVSSGHFSDGQGTCR